MPNKGIPFNPSTDIPSLSGKVILITGANSGLGQKSALELSKHNPSELWITARSTEKAEAAVAEIKAVSPNANIKALALDLGSFESIKAAAKKFLSEASRLDVLMLNAGIFGHPPALTEDGYEIHMGTNHLGHALLLKLLAPLLVKSAADADVRVLILTSIGWRLGPKQVLEFETFKTVEGASPIMRYVQSKFANMLYAEQVAKHFPQFTTISLHPGEVGTALFSREPGDEQIRYLQKEVVPTKIVPVDEGVKNQLWAAGASGLVSGAYYEPVGVLYQEKLQEGHVEIAEKLWDWTEKELEGQVV
ncbi:hypothetical protein M409DRAFT_48640 [Zasmidium cellare ATCC 36951]|uniref:Uncharacterized protein n=1 Tax=Zasmidium cellare ATCC 36951 TaxID=1080233 RepID=A0A6A6D655_ZASCE|nr:uncharacterized protein M409DRAFT_48640 [Zasmidium cellare ATCC 36951]KAF2173702.1 hypothetical protein M409DRAFT_48640 [Zasmidium cellare ATCC 36951]